MDEQTKKLHLAYLLKSMEELRDGPHAEERSYLMRVIGERRRALAACYGSEMLTRYESVMSAYRELAWHRGDLAWPDGSPRDGAASRDAA